MRYVVSHRTVYEYHNSVSVSHHLLRLHPRDLEYQRPSHFQLNSEPQPAVMQTHEDYFGNQVSFMTIERPHRQLTVISQCEVEVHTKPAVDPAQTPPWESLRVLTPGASQAASAESSEFGFPSSLVSCRREFREYAASAFPVGRPILEAGIALMQKLHTDLKFDAQATTVATPVEHVFRDRRGVCQDFAHLQIACFRSMGVPARYVSGYLETEPPPGQSKLVGADASHAWVQLWCGGAGWIDLDPTNNLLPGDRHITLAWGRDFADVSPLRGVLVGSGSHQLSVAVDVAQMPV